MGGHRNHERPTKSYTQYVKQLVQGGYPNLAHLYSFLTSRYHPNEVFVHCVDLKDDDEGNEVHHIPRNDVRRKIREPIPDDAVVRIFLVEDLDPDIIEAFGLGLIIEPKFFANHVSDAFSDPGTTTGRCPHLPSVSHIKSFYTIDYCHPIDLGKRNKHRLCCSTNVRRLIDTFHYVVRRPKLRDTALDHVAFVRRKFSFYVQPVERTQKWRVLVLADPSVLDCCRTHSHDGRAMAQHRRQFEKENSDLDPYNEFPGSWPSYSGTATFHRLDDQGNNGFHSPRGPNMEFNVWDFQGGYVDVLPPPLPSNPSHSGQRLSPSWLEELRTEGIERRTSKLSPAEDLIYYWTEAPRETRADHRYHPRSAALGNAGCENDISRIRRFLFDVSRHALFIAASECMLTLQALDASADARIWDLRGLDLAESPFKAKTARALEHYLDDALRLKHLLKGQSKQISHVQDFIQSVNMTEPANELLTRVLPGPFGPPEHSPLQMDWTSEKPQPTDYGLGEDYLGLRQGIEDHVKSCEGTITDIPTLMSVRDSHYAGSLAKLGMIFLPVTVVTGIMSIQTPYGMNQPSFWVFWVVSLAAMTVTILITFIPTDYLDQFIEDIWWTHYRLGYRRTIRVLRAPRERNADGQV